MITVVNKHYHIPTPDDYYIGRGSPLGNKFTHLTGTKAQFICETREEAVERHEKDLIELIILKDKSVCNALNDIFKKAKRGNVNLVCFCKPKSCHGDTIKKIIEGKLKI